MVSMPWLVERTSRGQWRLVRDELLRALHDYAEKEGLKPIANGVSFNGFSPGGYHFAVKAKDPFLVINMFHRLGYYATRSSWQLKPLAFDDRGQAYVVERTEIIIPLPASSLLPPDYKEVLQLTQAE